MLVFGGWIQLMNFDVGFGWMNAIIEFKSDNSNFVSMDGIDKGG